MTEVTAPEHNPVTAPLDGNGAAHIIDTLIGILERADTLGVVMRHMVTRGDTRVTCVEALRQVRETCTRAAQLEAHFRQLDTRYGVSYSTAYGTHPTTERESLEDARAWCASSTYDGQVVCGHDIDWHPVEDCPLFTAAQAPAITEEPEATDRGQSDPGMDEGCEIIQPGRPDTFGSLTDERAPAPEPGPGRPGRPGRPGVPVLHLPCLDPACAQALADHLRAEGVEGVEAHGETVDVPTDRPGFAFTVGDLAVEKEWAGDSPVARVVANFLEGPDGLVTRERERERAAQERP